MTLRIGIAGSTGRMGLLLAEEVTRASLTLAGGIGRGGDIAMLAATCDVVIDFTHADAVQAHAAAIADADVAWVLGTSGLTEADEVAVTRAAERISVVQAANFSPGVTMMLDLAERMARLLPADAYDVEIVEMHHRQKVDAPSGTAMALGRAVARGRDETLRSESGRDGHVGPRSMGAVGFSALRGGQVVGEHTLLFAGADEHIALHHRAFDRRTFAVGAVRAALWAYGRPIGRYDMRDVLELPD